MLYLNIENLECFANYYNEVSFIFQICKNFYDV